MLPKALQEQLEEIEKLGTEEEEEEEKAAAGTEDEEQGSRQEEEGGEEDETLKTLLQEITSLRESLEKEEESDDKEEEEPKSIREVLREKLGDDIDDEILSIVETVADAKVEQAKKEVQKSIEPVKEQLGQLSEAQVRTLQQKFVEEVNTKAGADLSKVLTEKGFKEFLSKKDPNGLVTYGEVFQAANTAWDADRMAAVIKLYKQQSGGNQTDVAPETMPLAAATTTSDGKKIWTEKEINDFALRDARGKVDPEESKRIWDDILRAGQEGRIR